MDPSAASTLIAESDLTRLLPTCQRCRRLRRKCDTQLPACRLCQKGKAECTFFDHALQQNLPRSYVHSLLSRLARLRSVQATINGTTDPNAITSYGPYGGHARQSSTHTIEPQPGDWKSLGADISFDKHIVLENANPTCWQFFGSSSSYSLTIETLVHGQAKFGQLTHPENYDSPDFKLNQQIPESLERPQYRPTPTREDVEALVNLYKTSVNVINGYSDSEKMDSEIDSYLQYQGSNVKYLTGQEAHQFFRTAMICAIAAASKARQQGHYASESFAYYLEALQCIEEVTSDISIDALQALLLLVLFTFFYPRRGDAWKLLDYACRLSVELNFHTETNDEYEDEITRDNRRSMFWGLYTLERTFGQHVGRPSDLPEEIITAEYPANLTTAPVDPNYLQYMLISHFHRLIYLRSEIFRILYMPVVAPELPRSWYEARLEDLVSWQREMSGIEASPGMGTMQCEMGFNTSINFICQPLILRALVATKDPSLPPNCIDVVPRESYDAACRSIEFYNKVINSPEGTPEGDYPVTIISGHYIQQATITFMAHCLLALDGRLPVVSLSQSLSGPEPGGMDFRNAYEISETCIGLLNHLASRWLGMVGILDSYRSLHDKVLPAMMKSDLL